MMLRRRHRCARPARLVSAHDNAFSAAASELRLRVAHAVSDGPLRFGELEALTRFVDEAGLDDADTQRLDALLRRLVDAPPIAAAPSVEIEVEPRGLRTVARGSVARPALSM